MKRAGSNTVSVPNRENGCHQLLYEETHSCLETRVPVVAVTVLSMGNRSYSLGPSLTLAREGRILVSRAQRPCNKDLISLWLCLHLRTSVRPQAPPAQ